MANITRGDVTEGTQANLMRGLRARPLSPEAAKAVVGQAEDLLKVVVERYEKDVAIGEVGASGTAKASAAAPLCGYGPTGLLFGRVQSGKTNAMIMTAALAFDNGFRVIVVLTANNVELVKQTFKRFKDLDGPRVFSTVKNDAGYEWEGETELSADVEQLGMLIVVAKDSVHLPAVVELLRSADAAGLPALIFDDEADNATLDTTLAARTSGRAKVPPYESTIYRNVVENTAIGESGESLREALPHHVFIQVTATPAVLLLQESFSLLRPSFIKLLEPAGGYCGGEAFFDAFDPDGGSSQPPLVLVDREESRQFAAARRGTPTGLANSIAFFLLSSAALSLQSGMFPKEGYKHLSHTSLKIDEHTRVTGIIRDHVASLRRALRRQNDADAVRMFQDGYMELLGSLGANTPSLQDLLGLVKKNISQTEIMSINTNADAPKYGPTYNFLIGGNILGRGLTIDDLLVTYYIREAKVPQMDTVWQHARMYGYREPAMAYTRVFLPRHLADLFQQIHQSEQSLRMLLPTLASPGEVPIPILRAEGSRVTRPNAIATGVLRVYGGDQTKQIFPFRLVTAPAAVGSSSADIRSILVQNGVPLEETQREARPRVLTLETAMELVKLVPVSDNETSRWDGDAIVALLKATSERYGNEVTVYVRTFDEDGSGDLTRRRPRGVLGGTEMDIIRKTQADRPFILALVYAGSASNPLGWYPTLVVPSDLPNYIFNPG